MRSPHMAVKKYILQDSLPVFFVLKSLKKPAIDSLKIACQLQLDKCIWLIFIFFGQ